MSRLRARLLLATSILACAALGTPADAPAASARHARTHRTASSCRRGASHQRVRGSSKPKPSCTTAARRAAPKSKPARGERLAASDRALQSVAAEAAASQAVTIAKVLATPCQNTNLTPEPANLPQVRAAVLCLVNTERAQNGRQPLLANAALEAAAESHGREMIADDYFDHISPSGITPVDRVRQSGYIPNAEVGYVVGENLAWGTLSLSTPASIVAAWIASPEHLANILESKYVETGIDVEPQVPQSLAEGVQGALYTQEFGVIVH